MATLPSDLPSNDTTFLLGRLNWSAIPPEKIVWVVFAVVFAAALALVLVLTKYRCWGYLWREWFTSVDHKKIGVMYMVLGLVMFARGFSDAIMMSCSRSWPSTDPRAIWSPITMTRSLPPMA